MSRKQVTVIAEVEYEDAVNSYRGWCTRCEDFTRGSTEGDAENYPCPSCDLRTVVGAEQALLSGVIQIRG